MTDARNVILISTAYGILIIVASLYPIEKAKAIDLPPLDNHVIQVDVDINRQRHENISIKQKKDQGEPNPPDPLDLIKKQIKELQNRFL